MPSQSIISLSEREQLIRTIPAFRDLSVTEISQLASIMQEVYVTAGEVVVREGDLIDSVFIVASGRLEVTKQVGKEGSTFLAVINPGESMGLKETGLFTESGRRTATVTAETSSILLRIDIKDFNEFLNQHPQTLQSMKATTDVMLRMQFIKDSHPFVHLSNQRIAWLAGSVKVIDVKKGEILFKQNDPVDNCYMIVEGKVEISTNEDDHSKLISTLAKGQLFGEQALFKNTKRTTTARAVTACRLMVLDQDTLQELSAETEETPTTLFSQTSGYNRPIRLENIIYHHRKLDDGQVFTTLKDPITNQYFQLDDEGWYIWQLLNGKLTIQEISQKFAKHYKHFDPQTVITTINSLIDGGFAKADVMQSAETTSSKQKTGDNKSLLDRFQWLYAVKHPDNKITTLYRYFGFIFFFPPTLIIIAICIIAGIIFYPAILNNLFQSIVEIEGLYMVAIEIVFLIAILRLVNPLAKALTIKYFGHVIPNLAIGLRFLLPVVFVDTSDLWTSSRLQRSMTSVSGIIATLFIASILTIFAKYYPDSIFAVTAAICALFLYFLTLWSLDPLLDLDGYQTLVNALDAQKLRESALLGVISSKSVPERNRKHIVIYFIYYFSFVILNFIFIYIIQHQLKPYGLSMLWNNGLVYIVLFLGLFLELLVELNYLNKRKQVVAGIE